jgi:VanZ family protein
MDADQDNFKFFTILTPTVQNLLHIPVYGVLACLWLSSFDRVGAGMPKKLLYSIIITMAYGFLDEFHQTFIPGRYGSILDILFNLIGITCGTVFFFLLQPRWRRKGWEAGRP